MSSAATPVSAQREPELAGQTVVVIGGSAGIGLETARRARAEAADVILTGRNPDRLKPSVTCRAWPRAPECQAARARGENRTAPIPSVGPTPSLTGTSAADPVVSGV
jgi:NAD(P)-dependent dehydrogenase (short-subunit alcohol dehydrogenase family)